MNAKCPVCGANFIKIKNPKTGIIYYVCQCCQTSEKANDQTIEEEKVILTGNLIC